VHDEIGADLEGTLVGGGGERVVDRDQGIATAGDDAREIDHVQLRVGGRLDPNEPGVHSHGALERRQVGLVDQVVGEPPTAQHLVNEAVRASVQVGRQDHVRAGFARHREQSVLGGQAGREGHGAPAFQFAERVLERGASRIGRARVVVVLHEVARPALSVGRGLVDGGDDRAVGRVSGQTRVNRSRGERVAAGRRSGHEASASSRSVRVTMPSARPSRVTSSAC
jgi:hypothetical protein